MANIDGSTISHSLKVLSNILFTQERGVLWWRLKLSQNLIVNLLGGRL